MGLGLFLIPALGGYWCLTRLNCTRYSILRDTGYHLFFRTMSAGAVLFAASYLIGLVFEKICPQFSALWKIYVPFDYAGTVVLSALLGVVIPIFCNRFHSKDEAEKKEVEKSGDLIGLVLLESIGRNKFVELSLKSGKSYIGLVLRSETTNHGESDVALIPMASGYRDKDTHALEITTNYAPTINECLREDSDISGLLDEDFRVVVPKSDISSARIFYPEVYEVFRKA